MVQDLPPLYSTIIGMMPPGKYTYATAPAVIAVCMNESGGVPTFNRTEILFQQNMGVAVQTTTLPKQLLEDALKIDDGPLVGQIAKFRFEPGYWDWTKNLGLPSVTLRFLCSCSFGVGQMMMRWILPPDKTKWEAFIERYKGDVNFQLNYVIETLERWLADSEGDLFKAYKAYNSGKADSTDPAVIQRATHVVALRAEIQHKLQG
jgi:Mac 1